MPRCQRGRRCHREILRYTLPGGTLGMFWCFSPLAVSRQTPDVIVPRPGQRPVRSCARRPPLPPGASAGRCGISAIGSAASNRRLAAGGLPYPVARIPLPISCSPRRIPSRISRPPLPVSRSHPSARSRTPHRGSRQRRPAAALSRGIGGLPAARAGLPQAAPPSWRGSGCWFCPGPAVLACWPVPQPVLEPGAPGFCAAQSKRLPEIKQIHALPSWARSFHSYPRALAWSGDAVDGSLMLNSLAQSEFCLSPAFFIY